MNLHTRLVKLKVEAEYKKKLKPLTNKIDFIWHDHEKDVNEQYVQLVATDRHPTIKGSGTMRHIDEQLSEMPVCQDAVRERKNAEKGPLHRVDTIVGHPGLVGDRDYLKSRMKNVKDKWVSKERLLQINARFKELGYDKGVEVEEVMHHPTKPLSLYRIKIGEIESG
jgi:hypothetical protein